MLRTTGLVVVAAAGTPVRLTSGQNDPTARVAVQGLTIQARPANTGLIYIGTKNMNKATGANIFGVIPIPTSATAGPFASFEASLPAMAAGLNLADFYIDATVNGDGVFARYTQG